ncbi:unnamed protein product [Caenorhabditis bovis]|uniref:Uncharacterized protein n=1 Tax=Caenorhabditis bovis TaxID=2654633 RepID=A0A8S1EZS8_9PELO|nr:unnamed protein product [Caenorhabditis bovis]
MWDALHPTYRRAYLKKVRRQRVGKNLSQSTTTTATTEANAKKPQDTVERAILCNGYRGKVRNVQTKIDFQPVLEEAKKRAEEIGKVLGVEPVCEKSFVDTMKNQMRFCSVDRLMVEKKDSGETPTFDAYALAARITKRSVIPNPIRRNHPPLNQKIPMKLENSVVEGDEENLKLSNRKTGSSAPTELEKHENVVNNTKRVEPLRSGKQIKSLMFNRSLPYPIVDKARFLSYDQACHQYYLGLCQPLIKQSNETPLTCYNQETLAQIVEGWNHVREYNGVL